jgi:hypothetical protein
MGDAEDEDDQRGVVDLVDDAVVAERMRHGTGLAGECLDARLAYVVGERDDRPQDAGPRSSVQLPELLPCRPTELAV